MNKIVVDKYDDSACHSINEAFRLAEQVTGGIEIYIKKGIYDEKLELNRDNVIIRGESNTNTLITYNDYARKLKKDGTPYGTFNTATLKLVGNNIRLINVTVENRSGNGRDFGQAVALFTDGDRIQVIDCRLLAAQDTLYMGPLPECSANCEMELPKEDNKCTARQYFKNCFISGDIDFIFGGATAYFDECEIFSRYNITEDDEKYNETIKGYNTAPCTWRGQKYGFVFNKCKFTGDCPRESVYLGRPWRIYAKTVLLGCEIGAHIKKEGWHDWNKPLAHETTFYAEYDCKYEIEPERVSWSHILTDEQAKEYTISKVLWEGIKDET